MTKKTVLHLLATICFAMIFSFEANAGIVGSKHDFASGGTGTNPSNFGGNFYINTVAPANKITETCVFCHTRHRSSTDAANGSNTALWNRQVPAGAAYGFRLYTSTSSSFVSQNPTGLSLMCLSCHDGMTSIAVGTVLLNRPGTGNSTVVKAPGTYDAIGDMYWIGSPSGAGANIGDLSPGYGVGGINLSDDHPVSFPWAATAGIVDIVKPTAGSPLRLFGASERMECSTCHNVHDPSIPPFLAMSNTNSAMCRACHNK